MKYLVNNDPKLITKYLVAMLSRMGISEIPEVIKSTEENIHIDEPMIFKQADNETHMNYKFYMMLHLKSDKTPNIKAVCYAIEIIEDMEKNGFNIIEKGIYQGAFSEV